MVFCGRLRRKLKKIYVLSMVLSMFFHVEVLSMFCDVTKPRPSRPRLSARAIRPNRLWLWLWLGLGLGLVIVANFSGLGLGLLGLLG